MDVPGIAHFERSVSGLLGKRSGLYHNWLFQCNLHILPCPASHSDAHSDCTKSKDRGLRHGYPLSALCSLRYFLFHAIIQRHRLGFIMSPARRAAGTGAIRRYKEPKNSRNHPSLQRASILYFNIFSSSTNFSLINNKPTVAYSGMHIRRLASFYIERGDDLSVPVFSKAGIHRIRFLSGIL